MSLFTEENDEHSEFVSKIIVLVGVGLVLMLFTVLAFAAGEPTGHAKATWDPLHFKPAIEQADDKECLVCHAEVLKPSVRAQSPAGVRADQSIAWYQTLEVYTGNQDTFHRRHLIGDSAKKLMNLRCNTCHQGHDPRDEAPGTSATTQASGYTLRKQVDPQTCLMCHGQFNYEVMGLPGPWTQHGETFGNNCLLCHDGIRTARHNVNFLKPRAIEAAGRESSENCYGCHGGRAWYRIPFPYPRHAWDGMDKDVPDWAKNRPTASQPRFLLDVWIPPAVEPAVEPAGAVPTASATPATPAPAAKSSSRKTKPKSRPAVARKASKSGYVRIQTYKGSHYVSQI
jgi:nitrate/TMAO reductase-like tetraheme cytochrome c subunit